MVSFFPVRPIFFLNFFFALSSSLALRVSSFCPPFLLYFTLDSLSELKRKFKDVLRAYWRQHKSSHEGEDTDQYDVAHRIATSIFNLYWDKPNYAGLRPEKKEILNYFVKHIQLSKSREGQSSNPLLRAGVHGSCVRLLSALVNDAPILSLRPRFSLFSLHSFAS